MRRAGASALTWASMVSEVEGRRKMITNKKKAPQSLLGLRARTSNVSVGNTWKKRQSEVRPPGESGLMGRGPRAQREHLQFN
jgi:hypothetical protein